MNIFLEVLSTSALSRITRLSYLHSVLDVSTGLLMLLMSHCQLVVNLAKICRFVIVMDTFCTGIIARR